MTALAGPEEIPWTDPAAVRCFLCGRPLTFPALHWSGASGHIYLDLNCWPELIERLAIDAYVARRILRSGRG